MVFITIDNGGSQIRVINNSEDRELTTYDKNIKILSEQTFRVKEGVNPYDVIRIVDAPSEDYKHLYAVGKGFGMYDGEEVHMNNQKYKSASLAWYQQMLVILATKAMEYAQKSYEPEVPVDFYLGTLIPAIEHSGDVDCAAEIKRKLAGSYEVEFPAMPVHNKVKFNLVENRIGVLPEGAVAITALRNEITSDDYSLIIDMGHITTDIIMEKGTQMIGHSIISSPNAGSTLLRLISNNLRQQGIIITEAEAVEALKTYKIRQGVKVVDISDAIDRAKHTFVSNYIGPDISSQIEISGVNAPRVQYVVPVGAVLGCPNPNTGKFDILDDIVATCALQNAEVKLLNQDLRLVNVSKTADFIDAVRKADTEQ